MTFTVNSREKQITVSSYTIHFFDILCKISHLLQLWNNSLFWYPEIWIFWNLAEKAFKYAEFKKGWTSYHYLSCLHQ